MFKNTHPVNYKRILLLALAVLYILAPMQRTFLQGFHKIAHLASHTSAAHEHEQGHLETAKDQQEKKRNKVISERVDGHEHSHHKKIASELKETSKQHSEVKHHKHRTVSSEAKNKLKEHSEEGHHFHNTNTTIAESKIISNANEHPTAEVRHQHRFVSFLNELFSSEKNTSDHIATQLELDKHFASEWYVSEELPRKYRTHTYFYNIPFYSAFQKVGLQPPKSNFS